MNLQLQAKNFAPQKNMAFLGGIISQMMTPGVVF